MKIVIMSQIKAPGPPIVIAVATPIIFPEPRVAERDMHAAWNVDMFFDLSFLNKIKKASFNFVIWSPFSFIVSIIPVTKIVIINGYPHKKSRVVFIMFK